MNILSILMLFRYCFVKCLAISDEFISVLFENFGHYIHKHIEWNTGSEYRCRSLSTNMPYFNNAFGVLEIPLGL